MHPTPYALHPKPSTLKLNSKPSTLKQVCAKYCEEPEVLKAGDGFAPFGVHVPSSSELRSAGGLMHIKEGAQGQVMIECLHRQEYLSGLGFRV